MFLKESISPSKSFNGLSSDGRQPRIPTPVPPYTKDELRQAAISKHQLENNLDQTSAAKNSLNSLEGVLTITLCQSQLQQRFPASSADQTNIVLNTQNLLQIRFETRNYQLFSSWRPVERDHKQCFIDWHREAIHIPVQISRNPRHPYNEIRCSLHFRPSASSDQTSLIASLVFHSHELTDTLCGRYTWPWLPRIGTLTCGFFFNYGALGYGYAAQIIPSHIPLPSKQNVKYRSVNNSKWGSKSSPNSKSVTFGVSISPSMRSNGPRINPEYEAFVTNNILFSLWPRIDYNDWMTFDGTEPGVYFKFADPFRLRDQLQLLLEDHSDRLAQSYNNGNNGSSGSGQMNRSHSARQFPSNDKPDLSASFGRSGAGLFVALSNASSKSSSSHLAIPPELEFSERVKKTVGKYSQENSRWKRLVHLHHDLRDLRAQDCVPVISSDSSKPDSASDMDESVEWISLQQWKLQQQPSSLPQSLSPSANYNIFSPISRRGSVLPKLSFSLSNYHSHHHIVSIPSEPSTPTVEKNAEPWSSP